jgi:hypothetical protein
MPQWRKIIVSGSDAELRSVTASNGFLGTASRAVVGEKVDVISGGSTTGLGIYSGSFSGSFVGSGTVASITAGAGLSGGTISNQGTISLDTSSVHFLDGVKKELNTEGVISSSGQVNGNQIQNNSVTYTAGSGLSGGGAATLGGSAVTLSVNTGSTHFISGARASISVSDTTGASGIDLTYNSGTGVLSGVLQNSQVRVNGTGITVTGGSNLSLGGTASLAVAYGSTANTAVQGNTNITINGTANEVEITGTAAQALGGGPSYTIGLPNDVSITNNLTVGGDLIVNGTTTTLNTNNILVEDRFILLNSGSVGSSIEGGIIIQSGSTSSGSALIFSTVGSANRWAFVNGLASNATTATPTAYVAQVTDMNVTAHANAVTQYEKAGNIRVETNGDILIYS